MNEHHPGFRIAVFRSNIICFLLLFLFLTEHKWSLVVEKSKLLWYYSCIISDDSAMALDGKHAQAMANLMTGLLRLTENTRKPQPIWWQSYCAWRKTRSRRGQFYGRAIALDGKPAQAAANFTTELLRLTENTLEPRPIWWQSNCAWRKTRSSSGQFEWQLLSIPWCLSDSILRKQEVYQPKWGQHFKNKLINKS